MLRAPVGADPRVQARRDPGATAAFIRHGHYRNQVLFPGTAPGPVRLFPPRPDGLRTVMKRRCASAALRIRNYHLTRPVMSPEDGVQGRLTRGPNALVQVAGARLGRLPIALAGRGPIPDDQGPHLRRPTALPGSCQPGRIQLGSWKLGLVFLFLLFTGAGLLDDLTERTGMAPVKGFGDGLGQGGLLRITKQHARPGYGLKQGPVQPEGQGQRQTDQDLRRHAHSGRKIDREVTLSSSGMQPPPG